MNVLLKTVDLWVEIFYELLGMILFVALKFLNLFIDILVKTSYILNDIVQERRKIATLVALKVLSCFKHIVTNTVDVCAITLSFFRVKLHLLHDRSFIFFMRVLCVINFLV